MIYIIYVKHAHTMKENMLILIDRINNPIVHKINIKITLHFKEILEPSRREFWVSSQSILVVNIVYAKSNSVAGTPFEIV